MIVGERLRAMREYKKLSQDDMEALTGLSRFYISRIENGRSIPTLETLYRFARAFEVPVFHLVYEEGEPYQLPILPSKVSARENSWNISRKEPHLLRRFGLVLRRLKDRDRKLLFSLARKMARQVTLHKFVAKVQRIETEVQRNANNSLRLSTRGNTSPNAKVRTRKGNCQPKSKSN